MDLVDGTRLSFWASKYDEKSENKSVRTFKNHHLNHAISIIIPGVASIPMDVVNQVERQKYFVVEDLSFEDILDFAFIEAFVRKGSLTLMSCNTRIDADFCFCVLPNGLLLINIPKEEYESLGLEGHCSTYFLNKQFKYVIQFDLKDPKLTYSSKKYLRIRKLLSNFEKKFDAMVTWSPPDKDISVESIYSYFMKKCLCRNGKLLRSSSLFRDFKAPLLDPERPDLCLDGSGPETFYEWLGAISCACSFGSSDSYENTLIYPETFSPPTDCAVYTIRGFFPSSVIEQFISSLRTWASKSDILWLSVTVHGFMDAPTSWSSVEHGFDLCGDNNHTAVLFPRQDITWSFVTHHSRETKF